MDATPLRRLSHKHGRHLFVLLVAGTRAFRGRGGGGRAVRGRGLTILRWGGVASRFWAGVSVRVTLGWGEVGSGVAVPTPSGVRGRGARPTTQSPAHHAVQKTLKHNHNPKTSTAGSKTTFAFRTQHTSVPDLSCKPVSEALTVSRRHRQICLAGLVSKTAWWFNHTNCQFLAGVKQFLVDLPGKLDTESSRMETGFNSSTNLRTRKNGKTDKVRRRTNSREP